MTLHAIGKRWNSLNAGWRSGLIAIRCVARGLFLFFSVRPATPLRVLCIMVFDTLHAIRNARPLPFHKLRTLAALLDFAACANTAFDNKDWRQREWDETLQLLEEAGMRPAVAEYLRKLSDLENRRPSPGMKRQDAASAIAPWERLHDDWQFDQAVLYRESVVRLSLGMLAATANGHGDLDAAVRGTYCDPDLQFLFRIVMQCQIIDDVLDYARDFAAGLPSFLTASRSLREALQRTSLATLGYADDRELPQGGDLLPLRLSLALVSALAKLTIALGPCWSIARVRHPLATQMRNLQPPPATSS